MAPSMLTRGIQLSLALRRAPQRALEPLPPHTSCPVCAGPTARHGARIACALCGYGTKETAHRIRRR